MVSERFAIAIAEIVIYAILLPVALFATVRQRSYFNCYFLLIIFCGLRISAGGLTVASENDGRTNRNNLIWSQILGAVGLGPLLVVGLGLITRVHDRNKHCNLHSAVRTHTARFLHVPNLLALILTIVSGVFLSSDDRLQQRSGKQSAQMGLSIFVAVFAVYTIICFATLYALDGVVKSERTILYGLTLAIPFVFLRILYATLAVFKDNNNFAIVDGSATVQLCMAVLMEMIIVIIYCGIGIFVPTERQVERRGDYQRPKQLVYEK
ncbi:MAG: hypothetical protein Q9180_007420 [Flavoplaca navasiana]